MSARAHAAAQVCRTDRWSLRIDASTTVRHANGWVDAWGSATRSGVLPYPEHGTNEYRPPEEVFDPASLATLQGLPLTIEHPDGLVTSSNVRQLTHGWVLRYAPADPWVRVQVRLASDEVLQLAANGVLELSCGYLADYSEEAGTAPDGTPYTGVQRHIRYNHLALVATARAGHAARLTLDSRGRMLTITLRKHTRTIPRYIADSIAQEAAAQPTRTDAGEPIATEEITLRGTSLVLPTEMVDALVAALGIGSASAPSGEAPLEDEAPPPQDPPQDPPPPSGDTPRMDASSVRSIVRQELQDLQRQQARVDSITARARAVIGTDDSARGLDCWGMAAAAVERTSPERRDSVRALAAGARRGDAHAAGVLEGLLLAAPVAEVREDGIDHVSAAARTIHEARRDSAPKPESADFSAEREAARQRKLAPRTATATPSTTNPQR